MVQVKYFVNGIWKPGDPMTLHWERPYKTDVETTTTFRATFTPPRYDDLYFKNIAILDEEDNQYWLYQGEL